MRVNLHDFSGHPFQMQLSRELAARGHGVVHHYSSQYVTGHGRLDRAPDDPATLRIEGISAPSPLIKYQALGRTRFELSYASAWDRVFRHEDFDVVVACNIPLLTLARMRRHFARTGQRWILWHQDLYSLGVSGEAARQLPGPIAGIAANWFEYLERLQVASADAVVAITDAMVEQYRAWGISRPGVSVVPNWAPLDEIRPAPRDNPWARAQALPGEPVRIMYAGTLGRKHNPLLLLELLDATKARGVDAMLVVASEGIGAEDLKRAARSRQDVRVIGYQPAESLSHMLASADVVVAVLEADAARYSVPSKVLSYLSAGKPIIALMPSDNPAARDVHLADGFVAAPTSDGARAAAGWLQAIAATRGFARVAKRARALAEKRFDIGAVADRFEQVLDDVAAAPVREPRDEPIYVVTDVAS